MSESPNSSRMVITRGIESPPIPMGPARLHYQYSVALPQSHLTFVSILQAIAFGVLLLNVPLPGDASCPLPSHDGLSIAVQCVVNQYMYLPYVISSVVILLAWAQFIYASMFEFWAFTGLQISLIYVLAVAEILTFKLIAIFPVWLIGVGFIGVLGGAIRLSNVVAPTAEDFESQEAASVLITFNQRDGIVYVILGLMAIVIGAEYPVAQAMLRYIMPEVSQYLPWIIMIVLLAVSLLLWRLGIHFRIELLRAITRNSDLEVSSRGIVRYKV